MPIDATITMHFGKHALYATRWSWGTRASYPEEREGRAGWGTQIETAAVIEMLNLVINQEVDPKDIRDRLTTAARDLVQQHDRDPYGDEDPDGDQVEDAVPAREPQTTEIAVPHQGQSPSSAAWATAQEHATIARIHMEQMDAAEVGGLADERAAHLDLAITYARLARIASEMLPR